MLVSLPGGTGTGSASVIFSNLSADGQTVIGEGFTASGTHAVKWSSTGGLVDLGALDGGIFASATAVSTNGETIVGWATLSARRFDQRALRWDGTTMTDLGTLGGRNSLATDVSADGQAISGWASTIDGPSHAVRWDGTAITDLGTLGGGASTATAISADGHVVVGSADTPLVAGISYRHAARWDGAVITDLGTLGGTHSEARDVSADGHAIAGNAATAGDASSHAVRWDGTVITDLGTLGGTYSSASVISADGNVVGGYSDIAGSSGQHAAIWRGATAVDAGVLPGGNYAQIEALSANGYVAVGNSDSSTGEQAVRWTHASGLANLNSLLASAGVSMTDIQLFDAHGVSADGRVISGTGYFAGAQQIFIVHYDDGAGEDSSPGSPATPIAGVTTPDALQRSADGLAAPLLSDDKPISGHNSIGAFGYGGSASGGGFAQFSGDSGLAVLMGVSYAQEDIDSAAMTDDVMGAAALRYVLPTGKVWRPFIEGGGWIAPKADLQFDRAYANGSGTAIGSGATQGDLSYLFGRAGVLFDFGGRNQLSVSGEIGKERLDVNGYAETYSRNNPFSATIGSADDAMTIAKVRVVYNFEITKALDAAVWAAGDFAYDRDVDVSALVGGGGFFSASANNAMSWAEFGGRIGYALTDSVTLDVFANGIAGDASEIDTRVHTGADLRYQF